MESDMVEVFAINTEENISEEIYKQLLDKVSEERQERVSRYKFEIDAKRSLFAGVLARYIVCSKTNMKNEDICFNNNKYGKPYLCNIENQYFNISHSGNWVVCGWSTHEIGVDVQAINDIDLNIAKKFFCESEYLSIMNTNVEEQKNSFYNFWTLKESYIKYKGCGFSIPIDSFEFEVTPGMINLISEDKEKPLLYITKVDKNHKLAICTDDTKFDGLIYVSLNNILDKLCK